MPILIENIAIIPMSGADSYIENGYLIIRDDHIEQLGAGPAPPGSYDKIINGRDQVLLPGLINTHTHAAMTLLRGYADDLPLMEWLSTKIWPLEAKLNGDDIYWGTMLAIVEMIKSGTTTFNDMYFFMSRAAEAVEASGMRAVLSRGMIGVSPDSQLALEDSRQLVGQWHGAAGDRIRFALGPHAPYTCPPDYLKQVVALAEELQVGLHIHIAETRQEVEDIINQYGVSPVQLMLESGVFSRPTLAAHCVHLSADDIAILKQYKVGVAHNPESNMKLASGIAPVPTLLKAGINVGLGTDGASSNNNLDMIQEMRSCALLHKVGSMDPTVIPAYQALEMGTIQGARALGWGDRIGMLKAGYKADMIIMNLTEANMIPRYDILANIIYSAQAADVDTVIINGKIVMENRHMTLIDEREVLDRCKAIGRDLVSR
ncbi:MAG: amidohydrolase [Syntrophomonadaceae bacterium]|jgi:5-methylthioadenosine/S-adenosylhomocysteine deaminase